MSILSWIAVALWETIGPAVVLAAFLWPLVTLHVYLKKHKQINLMEHI